MPWDDITRKQHKRDHLRYPSDLTDAEWAVVAPLIPPARRGRPAISRCGAKPGAFLSPLTVCAPSSPWIIPTVTISHSGLPIRPARSSQTPAFYPSFYVAEDAFGLDMAEAAALPASGRVEPGAARQRGAALRRHLRGRRDCTPPELFRGRAYRPPPPPGTPAMTDFTAHRHPVLAVPCPDCGAPVGAYCTRPSGHRASDFHTARKLDADRVWYEEEYPPVLRTPDGWAYGPLETARGARRVAGRTPRLPRRNPSRQPAIVPCSLTREPDQ